MVRKIHTGVCYRVSHIVPKFVSVNGTIENRDGSTWYVWASDSFKKRTNYRNYLR